MRMIERRENLAFRDEAFPDGRIGTECTRQLFDGNELTEFSMTPCEDDTARAPAELGTDLVGGEGSDNAVVLHHGRERSGECRCRQSGAKPRKPPGRVIPFVDRRRVAIDAHGGCEPRQWCTDGA